MSAPVKDPSTATLARLNVRMRVLRETGGRCSRCGEIAKAIVPASARHLEALCAVCNGRRGVAIREAKRSAEALQLGLFGDEPKQPHTTGGLHRGGGRA